MRISDWRSDVCSSDLEENGKGRQRRQQRTDVSAGKAEELSSGRWVHLNIPPSDFEVDHLGHDEGADAHPAKPANAHELHQAKAKQTHRIAGEEGRHVAIVAVEYEPENDDRQRADNIGGRIGLRDRKGGVKGKSVAVRVDLGGGR